MAAVWIVARAELRGRWRSWTALALLLGIVGGVALAAAAGARRSSSAFDRLLARSDAHDVEVQVVEEARAGILDDVASLPQVAASGQVALFPAGRQAPGGDPEPFKWDVTAAAVVGDGLARDLDIPRLEAGREMSFDEPHEAMASEVFLRQRGLGVGDDLTIQMATFPEVFELFGGRFPIPTAPEATVRIVGVWKLPHDVSIAGQDQGLLYLSPAFFRTYASQAAAFEGLMVRLRNGKADVASFIRDARALAENPEALSFTTQAEINADVQRAVDVMAGGLWVFAGILGGVALLIIGQSMTRAMAAGADDLPILRALAFGTPQRAAVLLIPIAGVAFSAAVVAVLVALLFSPATPLGFVREIEPSPGFAADDAVLGLGATAVFIGMTARALWPAFRLARRAARRDPVSVARPSIVVDGAVRAGLSPGAVTGVRFALEPGGPSGVPVRSALGGVVAAMIAVVAVFSFGPSMDRVLHHSSSYGWTWDVLVFGGEDPELVAEQFAALGSHPLVSDHALLATRTTTVGEQGLQLIGFEQARGAIHPTVIEGRAPRAHDEIALGAKAMSQHATEVGGTLMLPAKDCAAGAACRLPFRVVGKVVPPPLDGADLGAGSIVTYEGLDRVRTTGGLIDFAVRLRPGVGPDEAVATFERDFGDAAEPMPPVELLNLDRVRPLPDLLAALLVLVGLAVLGHALVTGVRRRGRDLAILKTIGFRRAQVRAAVAWHATTMIAAALLVGIPVGLVAGRWLWRVTADRLGVASDPVLSVASIAAGGVALVLVANLVATLPARAAARTQPAVVLRSE